MKLLMLQKRKKIIHPVVDLDNYDRSQPTENFVQTLKEIGYHADFLNDIKQGLNASSVDADNEP